MDFEPPTPGAPNVYRPAPREARPMARATWDVREQPILEAIADVEETQGDNVERIDALVELTGLDRLVVLLGLRALLDAGYVAAIDAGARYRTDEDDDFLDIHLQERGRRAVGQWPSEDSADALLELLSARVSAASTDDERTRWERLLDAAKGLSGKALQDLTIAFLKHRAGL